MLYLWAWFRKNARKRPTADPPPTEKGGVVHAEELSSFGSRHYSSYRLPLSRWELTCCCLLPAMPGKIPIYIRPTTTLTDVERQLQQNTRLRRPSFFHLAARYYKLEEKLRPGRYGIAPRMNTKQILETLAHGKQSAVRFHLRHVRTQEDLIGRMTGKLMMKPEELSSCWPIPLSAIRWDSIHTPSAAFFCPKHTKWIGTLGQRTWF